MGIMLAILDTGIGKLEVMEIAFGLSTENIWWWVPCSTLCVDLTIVTIIRATEVVDTVVADLTMVQKHLVGVIGMGQIVATQSKQNQASLAEKLASEDGVRQVAEVVAIIQNQLGAEVVAQGREVEDLGSNNI